MLNVVSDNSVAQSVFRLIICALLLVLSASSAMVGLSFTVKKSDGFILDLGLQYYSTWHNKEELKS